MQTPYKKGVLYVGMKGNSQEMSSRIKDVNTSCFRRERLVYSEDCYFNKDREMPKIFFLVGLFFIPSTAFGRSADFDGSGTIDFNDFLLFVRSVGTNSGSPKYSPAYDLDADQSIGFHDFRLFAASFGNFVIFPPVGSHHEMVPIPEGHFLMGTESGNSTMRPAHTVYLNAFLMDRFEVTNGRFLAFLNERGGSDGNDHIYLNPDSEVIFGQPGGRYRLSDSSLIDHPVVNVSWYGARDYCEWIDGRLPTEAEWEKAARGSDGRVYPWGNDLDPRRANFQENGDPFDNGTTPVGYFDGSIRQGYQTRNGSSPFGVHDLAGNAWEWVNDRFSSNYYSRSPSMNPAGASSGEDRVLRGGCWEYHESVIRTSYRLWYPPTFFDSRRGFRCAR